MTWPTVLDHESLLEQPEKWQRFYPGTSTWVLSSRDLPELPGADLRVVDSTVSELIPELLEAAAGRDVWVMGGGDVAGQFADADRLDRIMLSVAAVTLGSGAPLLPRRLESDRLRLVGVRQVGQFAELTYDVLPA